MSKLSMARAIAGPDASNEDVVRWLYSLDKQEHWMWWGRTKPFPEFVEWLQQQPATEKD